MADVNPKYDPSYEDQDRRQPPDEPACGEHGVRFMFDGEDFDGNPVVECVACMKLQNGELLTALIALADRVSVRFGETIKYEPVATGRYLDAAYEVIGKVKATEKRKNDWCGNCGAVLANKDGKSWPSCDSCS